MVTESSTSSERMIERELMVTGEAVALEVVPATVVNRITSGIIDYAAYLLGGALSMFGVVVLATADGPGLGENLAFVRAIIALVALAWMVVIPLLVELLSGGRSLGRMVTGTRVVRDDGGTVRLRHCLVRTLLAVVEIWLTWAMPAVCISIVSKRGKRLGDLLAGTYVVRDRHRSATPPPLLMPPELAQWAAGTDLRRSARRAEPDGADLPATGLLPDSRLPFPSGARAGVPCPEIRLPSAAPGHAPRTVPRRGAHRATQP